MSISSPSSAKVSWSTPAVGDGTSIEALSESTSNRGSPSATASPGFFNHRAMNTLVMDSPIWGIVTSTME